MAHITKAQLIEQIKSLKRENTILKKAVYDAMRDNADTNSNLRMAIAKIENEHL